MRENLSFKNIFKRETKLATYIIVCLTIVVLSLSYAMFFKVDGNSKNQVVKAGDLEFTYENSSNEITNTTSSECFMPMTSDETSLYLGTCDYKLSVHNTGSLKGAYTIKLKANEGNTIDAEYLKVILRKQEGDILQVVSGFESGKKVSELAEGIVIEDEEMASGSTVVYSISLYVAEDSLSGLESSVVDGIVASKISYSIEGTGLVHESQDIHTELAYCEQNPETGACTILAQGETEELKFDNTTDKNLRYIGANPNNYVTFNNELWRIIGVFNNIDNGSGTKEARIKLIRDESIGKYSWDYSADGTYDNDWSTSTLMSLLNNGAYYNRTTGSYYNNSTTPITVDFSSTGLTSESRSMISDAVWKLGGTSNYTSNSNGLASHWYTFERGTTIYEGRPTEWTGKIGLMYPSDYGYATSGGSTTNRGTCLNNAIYNWDSSSVSDCKNNDWLYNSWFQWTLTSYSSVSGSVFYVRSNGPVYRSASYSSYAVSPTLYLNTNVKISGGSGTEESPYTLTME